MLLYKAIGGLDIEYSETVNAHSILEESIRLYKRTKKVAKTHRSVADKNLGDVKHIEKEFPLLQEEDTKILVERVVKEMNKY